MFLPVPPKSIIKPKRKQNLYDFANETYNYGTELENYKSTREYSSLSDADKDSIEKELSLLQNLNSFQVEQIDKF